jgi:ectoine hydroxylase-related dioxygenase (phytanoyl-CoA dioxygenase family)
VESLDSLSTKMLLVKITGMHNDHEPISVIDFPMNSCTISEADRRQFQHEGYFILESALDNQHLDILRNACDHLIDLMHQEMDRLGTDHIHISHRGKRYHIAKQHHQAPRLDEYVFSDLMAEICRATIGNTAYLFYDQYVVKAAEQGIKFSWHQDGGYLGFLHRPYVTVWAAVDDMTLDNGTVFVMPYSQIGIRSLVEHIRDPETGDKIGYFGKEAGVSAIVPAGSLVVFSSLAFHRSGNNTTDQMRRAYVTQYSAERILDPENGLPKHLAVPFMADGKIVHDSA